MSETAPSCPQVDPGEAAEAGATLIDVRDPDDFAAGHPAGAVNLPLAEVRDAPGALPAGPLTFTCKTGRRSQMAADAAVEAGRTDVANMTGGLEAWTVAGLPVETS